MRRAWSQLPSWLVLLELVVLAAASLWFLRAEHPFARPSPDTIRDYVVAREGVALAAPITRGPTSSIGFLDHFPTWTRLLALSWRAGLPPRAVHELLLLCQALAVALLYVATRRLSGPGVAWVAAGIGLVAMGPTAGSQTLLNPAAAPLPFMVFVVASIEAFRRAPGRGLILILVASAGLSLAIGLHVMFFCQLPILLLAAGPAGANPATGILLALGVALALLARDSGVTLAHDLARWPVLALALGITPLMALAARWLGWRSGLRRERAARRFLWLFAMGNAGLVLAAMAWGHWSHSGAAPHYAFLAVPPLALLVASEAGRALSSPGIRRAAGLVICALVVTGVASRGVGITQARPDRSSWRLDDAYALSRHLEARGWSYRDVHERLQAPAREQLARSLGAFMGRTRGEPGRIGRDLVVLPHVGQEETWPSGWETVLLSDGRRALVFELPNRVTRTHAAFCHHEGGAAAPTCRRVDLSWPHEERRRFQAQDRGYGVLPAGALAPGGAAAIDFRFELAPRDGGGGAADQVIVFEDKAPWEARIVSTATEQDGGRGRAVVLEQRPPELNYGRNVDAPGFVVVDPETALALRRALQRTSDMEARR